ncbi:MAG: hypothetical protein OHK0019_25890 [Saprospiraceae bacterium]
MNPNISIVNQGAVYVEKQVIEWCKQMMNYLPEASGILVSSASMANVPALLVANAGTVNTSATDPLEDLVKLCREKGIWLHVDGAFGALAGLLPEFEPSLKWIGQADSVAFDLHKWMYLLERTRARWRQTPASVRV